MKSLLLFALISPLFSQAQYFSGEITYEISIISKSDTVDVQKIVDSRHGTTASYIITAQHYKSTYLKNGQYNYSYTYDDETKRMFDDYAEKPYVTFRDSRRANVQYQGSEIHKDSAMVILGYNCYLVKRDAESSTTKTYYSEDIKVDYADFEGHKVGAWYDKLKEVDGALPLKIITEYETYFSIREAVQVNERKVKTKEFKLPNKPVVAAYSALDSWAELQKPTREQMQCYQQKLATVSKPAGEKYTSYIRFVLQKDGKIEFVEPHEKDEEGFFRVAIDIIQHCGLQFSPGKIEGKPVESEVYFPIEFLR